MLVPQHYSKRSIGINMTPMIDVVFLLIIFFLVSSHLARQESSMELKLPNAVAGKEDFDQTTARITINVERDGSLWLGGQPIDAPQLTERFAQLRQEKGDGVEVRIRGSREAAYSTVEPIMLACTKASIWNVKYAVYREEQ